MTSQSRQEVFADPFDKTAPIMVNYSYEEMRTDLLSIIDSIESIKYVPEIVVGLTRGGLVPATMISHYFSVPLIPITLSLRDFKTDMKAVESEIEQQLGLETLISKRILVIDDILDSGETLKELSQIFGRMQKCFDSKIDNIRYAVLYYNYANNAEFIPDFYARQIDKSLRNEWIIFPFEQWWKQ